MDFTREDMWALEGRAKRAEEAVLNPSWKRALADLAHAASVVDAFIARSSVCVPPAQPTMLNEAVNR